MNTVPRIGFIGSGQMATALARGWLAAGLASATDLAASDPVAAARERFQSDTQARAVPDNPPVVAGSDVLVLAIKPQTMKAVLTELRGLLQPRHLVLSIAAGVTLRRW